MYTVNIHHNIDYRYQYKTTKDKQHETQNAAPFPIDLAISRGLFPKRRSTMRFTRFHWGVVTGWSLTLVEPLVVSLPTWSLTACPWKYTIPKGKGLPSIIFQLCSTSGVYMFLFKGCVTGEKSLNAIYFSSDWCESVLVHQDNVDGRNPTPPRMYKTL